MRDKDKTRGSRFVAWMLLLAMICSLVAVPAKTAQAAETTKDLSYEKGVREKTGDEKNQASVDMGKGGYSSLSDLKAAGVTALRVTFKVTEAVSSGENVGAQAFINAKGLWKGQWVNVNAGSGEQTVELDLTPYYTQSAELYNFGFQFENVKSVTYQITKAVLVYSDTQSGSSGGENTDFGTKRDYSSGVSVSVANKKAPTNDWSEFELTFQNNTGADICDWIVVLQVPSGTASAFKCWNATFVADGDTIYLYPMQNGTNAVVSAGTMQNNIPGGGFAAKYVDASNIQVKQVLYNKGSKSSYDYSGGDTNDETGGSGGSSGSSAVDTGTNKDLDVEYNYAKALQESLYFYDANMCGNLAGVCALDWRGNCHTYDKNVTYEKNGKKYAVDASGGFHDAGDHVKFGLPQGYAASVLGMSYYQFRDAFDELGQKEHLKAITDYFCDYFRRCTVYESGSVIAFCYQVGDGGSDHAIWSSPESQTLDRPAYFADASNPATDEVSVAIAALALNYMNFGNEQDLKVAKDLFAFVQANGKACATQGAAGFYSSDSYKDDYALAASALAKATGESSYKAVYDANCDGVNQYWVMDWANSGAMACMLQEDTAKLRNITDVCKNKGKLDGVFNCVSNWGSCRYSAAEQFTGLVYDKLTNTAAYQDWATAQMNYMLGDNPNKRCYIVGYNENSSKYPHHRAASRSTDAGVYNTNHYTLLGALVGGPGSDGSYKDDQADYYCNEVALDYNAGLVGAAAGLYLAHKDADTTYLSYAKKNADSFSKDLASEEELKALGVSKYYGTASATVEATAIELDQTSVSLTEGKTVTLKATVKPKGASQKVTWSSADPKIAEVDVNGKVTAVAEGTTTISATTKDGTALTAACEVTVKAAPKAELSASEKELVCDALAYGYEKGTSASLEIANMGDADAEIQISLEKGIAFEWNGKLPSAIAAGNGKETITVSAKTGLAVGTYLDSILITYDKQQIKIPVSVTVTKKAVQSILFPVAAGITVGDTLQKAGLSGGSTEYGSFAWKDETIQPERGSYKGIVVLTLSESAKKNYSFSDLEGFVYDAEAGTVSAEVEVTVKRAGLPEITFPTEKEMTVGQYLKDVELPESPYGVFAWADEEKCMTTPGRSQEELLFTWSAETKQQYGIEDTDEDAVLKNRVSVTVKKQTCTDVPKMPELYRRTKNSIAIRGVSGAEYSLDGKTWIQSGEDICEFTGLKPFTQYSVRARYAATAETEAGTESESRKVYTLVENPYDIDLSRIKDSDYVDALRTGNDTVTVKWADGTLTLQDTGAEYTIRGEYQGMDVCVAAENVSGILLNGAKMKSLQISNKQTDTTDLTIAQGTTSTVTDGIKTDAGSVKIAGAGTLESGKVAATGNVTIDGSTVQITVDRDTAAIESKGMIRISNASVNVVSDNAAGKIQSDNIVLTGKNTITATSGTDHIFSSAPKDEMGNLINTDPDKGNTTEDPDKGNITEDPDKDSDKGNTGDDSMEDPDKGATADPTAPSKDAGKVSVDKIVINGITKKVAPGKKLALKAVVYPENAQNTDVTWMIDDKDQKYATVDTQGVVHVKKNAKGKKITVTAVSKENTAIRAQYRITVMKQAVKKMKLTGKKVLKVKKTTKLKVKFTPSKGISKEVIWTSSNPKVAVVNQKGKVTAKKKGKVKITAKAKDGSGKKASITIKVK